MATTIRQEVSSRASEISKDANSNIEEEKETRLQQKIQKREHKYSRSNQEKIAMTAAFRGLNANPSDPRRRRRTRWQMSADERFQVVKMAASKTNSAEEIANHFNINVTAVYALVAAAKAKKFDCFVKKKKSEI